MTHTDQGSSRFDKKGSSLPPVATSIDLLQWAVYAVRDVHQACGRLNKNFVQNQKSLREEAFEQGARDRAEQRFQRYLEDQHHRRRRAQQERRSPEAERKDSLKESMQRASQRYAAGLNRPDHKKEQAQRRRDALKEASFRFPTAVVSRPRTAKGPEPFRVSSVDRSPADDQKHLLLNDERHGPSHEEKVQLFLREARTRIMESQEKRRLLSKQSILSKRNRSATQRRSATVRRRTSC